MILRKEEVILVSKWLDEKISELVDTEYVGYSEEEMEGFEWDEFMLRAAQEVVASVLNEI